MTDPFWSDDINIIINKQKYTDFVPMKIHTRIEKLNAILRLSIYLALILTILKENVKYLLIIAIFLDFYFLLNSHTYVNYTLPTKENPFMNVLINEYAENPNRGPAANINDPQIKKDIEQYYNDNLYKDVDDIWDKANSQRQYYTMPSTTIPNDRDSFMNWCYGSESKVCKDGDLDVCGRDDIQTKHPGQII